MGNEPEGEEKREAIVLRLSPTKDNDAMVTALCSGSLFSFFARGIRKPGSKNFPSCQPLSRSSFRLKRSKQGNYSLLEGESLEVMTKFGDLDAMVVSSLLSEAAEKVLSEDSSKQECHDAYLGLLDSLRQIKLGATPISKAPGSYLLQFRCAASSQRLIAALGAARRNPLSASAGRMAGSSVGTAFATGMTGSGCRSFASSGLSSWGRSCQPWNPRGRKLC